jgi:shikimate kinase
LSLSPKALAGRLEKKKHTRPLIRDLSQEDLVAFIEERLQDREKFYNKAEITVKGIDFTPEKVIEEIDSYLK